MPASASPSSHLGQDVAHVFLFGDDVGGDPLDEILAVGGRVLRPSCRPLRGRSGRPAPRPGPAPARSPSSPRSAGDSMPAGLSAGVTMTSRLRTNVCGVAGDVAVVRGGLHLGGVGRGEDVGLGAFGELGHQRLRAAEVVGDGQTLVGGFEVGLDLLEGVGQRRGGEDGQLAAPVGEGDIHRGRRATPSPRCRSAGDALAAAGAGHSKVAWARTTGALPPPPRRPTVETASAASSPARRVSTIPTCSLLRFAPESSRSSILNV